MKELVVMWVFDDESYQKILNIRKHYFNQSTDNHPHITFAHYLSIDEQLLIEHTDAFIKEVEAFEVVCESVMTLNKYVVLKTSYTNKLKDYYALFHKKFTNLLNEYTTSENFIPHITLTSSEHPINEVINAFKSLRLKIDKCEISWIKETGFEIIKTYHLKKAG
ncbi:MAG: 2'-5' RNA ligase family protein [Acholeplasmataceae bacterium]